MPWRERRQHTFFVTGQDRALVVRALDQPGRMIRVAEGHASLRVQSDEQLSNSLAGDPQLSCDCAAVHRPIEQIEQTLGARSGRPALSIRSIRNGFEAAGLAARGRNPELRSGLPGKTEFHQSMKRDLGLRHAALRLDCDLRLGVAGVPQDGETVSLRSGENEVATKFT